MTAATKPVPKDAASPATSPLKFVVAPHIVQDLGLNLYTTVAKVLVEFVANAYDADAKSVTVHLDKGQIWPRAAASALWTRSCAYA